MFFIPLFDDNPPGRRPIICWLIIAVCIWAYLWQWQFDAGGELHVYFLQVGFIPARLTGTSHISEHLFHFSVLETVVTSWFVHGGFFHLGSNMLYLWIFGDNVEDSMGRFRFIVFYALCGIAATMAQFVVDPTSQIPLIGASGAIAGVLGAYLLLHPRAAVRSLLVIIIYFTLVSIPAWVVLFIWIAGQFVALSGEAANAGGGGIAYLAHIGGFFAGMILIPFFKRPDVKLFGKGDAPKGPWDSKPVPFKNIRIEAAQRYSRRGNRVLGSRVITKHDDEKNRE